MQKKNYEGTPSLRFRLLVGVFDISGNEKTSPIGTYLKHFIHPPEYLKRREKKKHQK
jgi:hypothetical protein